MARARAAYEISAVDNASPAFHAVNAAMRSTASTARRLGANLTALISGQQLGALLVKSIAVQDEIGKLNRQLGVSTELLSEMRGVLSLTGVQFTTFVDSVRVSSRLLDDAAQGTKTAQQAFADLNVDFRALQRLSPDERILTLIDALRDVGSEYKQTALAQDLFGRKGAELLRLVNISEDEFNNLRLAQQAMGRSLSEDQTKAAEDASDAWELVIQDLNALVDRFTNFLTPSIRTVSEAFRTVMLPTIEFVAEGFKRVGQIAGGVIAAIVAAVQGNFSESVTILKSLFEDTVETFRNQFAIITDPAGYIDQQRAERITAAATAAAARGRLREVNKGNQGPTLFDADFAKVQELIGAYQAVLALKQKERGGGAEFDITLRSLTSQKTPDDDPVVQHLKRLEELMKLRTLTRVMEEVRDIIKERDPSAVFV